MSESTKLKNTLQEFSNTADINPTLLSQIENYIQKVEVLPTHDMMLDVLFDNKSMFFIINNTATQIEGHALDETGGVSLCNDGFQETSDLEKFEDCDLHHLFEKSSKHDALLYINFYYDAYSLCATIQYLAKYYGCPLDDVKIHLTTVNDWELPKRKRARKAKILSYSAICCCIFMLIFGLLFFYLLFIFDDFWIWIDLLLFIGSTLLFVIVGSVAEKYDKPMVS